MQIHVYDTHIKTLDGKYLHFDVLVNDGNTSNVDTFVKSYLTAKGIEVKKLTASSCQFCHSEIANPEVQASINKNGHYILPLSGC